MRNGFGGEGERGQLKTAREGGEFSEKRFGGGGGGQRQTCSGGSARNGLGRGERREVQRKTVRGGGGGSGKTQFGVGVSEKRLGRTKERRGVSEKRFDGRVNVALRADTKQHSSFLILFWDLYSCPGTGSCPGFDSCRSVYSGLGRPLTPSARPPGAVPKPQRHQTGEEKEAHAKTPQRRRRVFFKERRK